MGLLNRPGSSVGEAAAHLLPISPRREYMKNVRPCAKADRMANQRWLEHERGVLRLRPDHASAKANEWLTDRARSKQVDQDLLRLMTGLLVRTPWADDERMQAECFYTTRTGAALAALELESGRQVKGLVHPSIWNAISYAAMLDRSASTFSVEQRWVTAAAREGGYYWFRHPGLTPGDVFADCSFP